MGHVQARILWTIRIYRKVPIPSMCAPKTRPPMLSPSPLLTVGTVDLTPPSGTTIHADIKAAPGSPPNLSNSKSASFTFSSPATDLASLSAGWITGTGRFLWAMFRREFYGLFEFIGRFPIPSMCAPKTRPPMLSRLPLLTAGRLTSHLPAHNHSRRH